jgi:hypothetical protein
MLELLESVDIQVGRGMSFPINQVRASDPLERGPTQPARPRVQTTSPTMSIYQNETKHTWWMDGQLIWSKGVPSAAGVSSYTPQAHTTNRFIDGGWREPGMYRLYFLQAYPQGLTQQDRLKGQVREASSIELWASLRPAWLESVT